MNKLSTLLIIVPVVLNAMIMRVGEEEAYPTLQAAIFSAFEGDTILLTKGIYTTPLKVTFSLTIMGEQRDSTIVRTGQTAVIINSDVKLNVENLTLETEALDLPIVWQSAGTLRLKNCLLRGSNVDAIYVSGGSLTLDNCTVTQNHKSGIIARNANLNIIGSDISHNGINGIVALKCQLMLNNVQVTDNGISGVVVDSCENFLIKNSVFERDSATAISFRNSSGRIEDITAKANGTGIRVTSGSLEIDHAKLTDNIKYGLWVLNHGVAVVRTTEFTNNKYGIRSDNGKFELDTCKIVNNSHYGIYLAGGECSVSYSIIAYNGAHGIYAEGGEGELTYNLIYRNNKHGIKIKGVSTYLIKNNTIAYNNGHGILAYEGAAPQIINNIVAFNNWGIVTQVKDAAPGNPTLSHNNVYKNGQVDWSANLQHPTDISVDPQFVNPEEDNFYLKATSPCLNAGEGGTPIGALGKKEE